jgi:hypothetical protein
MLFNRLLEYRSRDQLEQMTDAGRATLLADVLRMGPSEGTWLSIYELFALWPDTDARRQSMDDADRELASWDDQLRSADTSSRALFVEGHLSSLARLVRSISIHRRGDGGRSELLAVVTSPEAAHLTRLSVVRSEVGESAWQTMVRSTFLGQLQHLHVTNTVVVGNVFEELMQSSRLPRLRCLKLIEVGMDEAYLRAASTIQTAFALQQVDFSRNLLMHDGVVALANAPWLRTVARLTLRHNHIREAEVRALLASPAIEHMTQIDLRDNDVTESDRAALMRLAGVRRVQLTL